MNRRHQLYQRIGGLLLGLLALLLSALPGWTAEDATNATTFDNAPSTSVTYTGSWTHSSGWSKAYGGTVSYSNQVGAKVKLTFSGRYITRVYSMTFNRGAVKVYIDGALKSAMRDYTSSTRWQVAKTWDAGWSGQHTIEVVNDGGGYIDADAFIVDMGTVGNGVYDNTHSQLKYIGAWDNPSPGWSAAYGNTLRWTNGTENAVSFTFMGDSVTYLYTKSTNRGKASVTIDGVDKGLLDLYASSPQFQQGTLYSGLGSGVHTIHVAATGQKNGSSNGYYIDVDTFKVGSVYNRTVAVNYADTWAHGRNPGFPNYGTYDGCLDCTNYVSQVLLAGGIPEIENQSFNDKYFWYSDYSWASNTWAATDWFKQHLDGNTSRYQFAGQTGADIETLGMGDFFIMDAASIPIIGPDHASVIVGWGTVEEGTDKGQRRQLRNAHCNDRRRVKWDYGISSNDQLWAYRVKY